MKEVWKPIILDDIQERYAVSNFGKVIDLKNQKYMIWHDNGAGYMNVGLMGPNSKVRVRYVHRLVAIAFLENPDKLPQVGHKDHTRANNFVENLYWTTQKQNTADGIEAGRINANRPKTNRKVTEANICEIALLSSQGKGVHEIAIMLNFPRTTISSVFNGRSNWELFEFARKEIKNTP
jgi:NUMOD4 motif.